MEHQVTQRQVEPTHPYLITRAPSPHPDPLALAFTLALPHPLTAHLSPSPLSPPRYLHKFKWNHLSEKASYEARVKQDKMRDELAQAKKETSFYLKKVGPYS